MVDDKGFCGVINRIDLTNLLQYPEVFRKRTDPPPDELIKYHSIHTDKDRFDNLYHICMRCSNRRPYVIWIICVLKP